MKMEPYFLMSLSTIGVLILLMVGWAVALLREISRKQAEHSESNTELRAILLGVNGTPGLVTRVNDLHQWRNRMQEKELAEVHAEVERLHEERRNAAIPDRRTNNG